MRTNTTTRTTTKGKARPAPQRTCVACRRTGDQSSFVRLVRTPDGTVEVDEGKRRAPGRGAYLCREAPCWDRGTRGALAGSLRTTLQETNREALRAYGARFTTTGPVQPEAGDQVLPQTAGDQEEGEDA